MADREQVLPSPPPPIRKLTSQPCVACGKPAPPGSVLQIGDDRWHMRCYLDRPDR